MPVCESAMRFVPSDHEHHALNCLSPMRVRLRVAAATHKLEVRQTFEELLVEVGQLLRCPPSDVRVGLNKQVDRVMPSSTPPPPSPSFPACRTRTVPSLFPRHVLA